MSTNMHSSIERIGAGDAMELATDVGPIPMNIAAVLVLDAAERPAGAANSSGPAEDAAVLAELIADRTRRIPRFQQRLVDVPTLLGRPIWVDAENHDPRSHVNIRHCPAPGDGQALLDLATCEAIRELHRSEPLWRVVVVHGVAGERLAVVLVVHHVLTDGMAGLAALAALADGAPEPADRTALVMPTRGRLARQRLIDARRAIAAAPAALHAMRQARAELGSPTHRRRTRPSAGPAPAAPPERWAPRCSLNTPISASVHVSAVDVELAPLLRAARDMGGSLNDLLLVAVTAALESLLCARGERLPALVVSVPISGREDHGSGDLGNRVGVMPVRVALTGSMADRVAAVAPGTARQKGVARGSSLRLLAPVFRGLAASGLLTWFLIRQRLINTILSNLRGPAEPLRLGGRRISSVIPVTGLAGNVTTGFTALSYGGRLVISVVTDPGHVPEHRMLADALAERLATLADQHLAP